MTDGKENRPSTDTAIYDGRVQALFLQVIDLPEDHRAEAIDRVCAGNPELRRAVESLLDADRSAQGFLENAVTPAWIPDRLHPADGDRCDGDLPRDRLIGQTIDGFTIQERIGAGGMGIVYRAIQDRPRRAVAVKIVRDEFATPDASGRLEFESEVLSRLRHPNVAQVFTAGTIEGTVSALPYFALEFVEGATPITAYARQHGLSIRKRLDLFLDACSAVQHGHEQGVIHRDLKPSNVLVSGDGSVKVIDFGIARVVSQDARNRTVATQSGVVMGSLPYMAPEQCTGSAHRADARSDVYGLGSILYELLCDHRVFDFSTSSLEESLRAVRDQLPPQPRRHNKGIESDLQSVILKALAKDPKDRYATAAEFAADLHRHVDHEPVLAVPPSVGRSFRAFVRRNPAVSGLAAAFIVTLIVAATVSTAMYVRANRARKETLIERDEAIAARKRADARRAEADAVTGFIADSLASVDPVESKGDEPTVRELLAAASTNVDQALADQPLAQARLRHVIGRTYYHMGDMDIAETQMRQALDLTRKNLGDDTLEYAERANDLAALLWNRRRYDESEKLLREALKAHRAILGPDHQDTLNNLSALATILSSEGHLDEAESLFREVIDRYRKLYPEGNPVLGRTLSGLGTVLLNRGEPQAAEPLIREAVNMIRDQLGPDHPFTNITLMNYVNVLQALNQHERALREADEALEQLLKLYGENHSLVASCLEKKSVSYEALNRQQEHDEAVARANRIRRELDKRNAAKQP